MLKFLSGALLVFLPCLLLITFTSCDDDDDDNDGNGSGNVAADDDDDDDDNFDDDTDGDDDYWGDDDYYLWEETRELFRGNCEILVDSNGINYVGYILKRETFIYRDGTEYDYRLIVADNSGGSWEIRALAGLDYAYYGLYDIDDFSFGLDISNQAHAALASHSILDYYYMVSYTWEKLEDLISGGHFSSVFVDQTGATHISHVSASVDSFVLLSGGLYVVHSENDIWSEPVLLADDVRWNTFSMVTDDSDCLQIVYVSDNRELKYIQYCPVKEAKGELNSTTDDDDITEDDDIIDDDDDYVLKYTRIDGTDISHKVVTDANLIDDTYISVHQNGDISIVYRNHPAVKRQVSYHRQIKNSVLDTGLAHGKTSMAIDDGNTLHLTYFKESEPYIQYGTLQPGQTQAITPDPIVPFELYTLEMTKPRESFYSAPIAVDLSGHIHITFRACGDLIQNNYDSCAQRYASNKSGSWEIETLYENEWEWE